MKKMKCHTYVHIEAEAEFQPSFFFLSFPSSAFINSTFNTEISVLEVRKT